MDFGRELKQLITSIIENKIAEQNLSDAMYGTWTGNGLKIDDKPIEIPKDMVNIPEHLKKYKVRVSFELDEGQLNSIAKIDAEDSLGGKVKFKHIKFDRVPMQIEYDKMQPGQRYYVQMKKGSNQFFILDRVPEEEKI